MGDNAKSISLEMLKTCIKAYRSEVEGEMPDNKRYMAAMIRNALEIALRDFEAGGGDPYQSIIDHIGDNQITTPVELAEALRASKITLDSHADLLEALINASRNELKISNPHALKTDAALVG